VNDKQKEHMKELVEAHRLEIGEAQDKMMKGWMAKENLTIFPTGSIRDASENKVPSRHMFDVEAGINAMVHVLEHGMRKYERNNWRKGQTYMRVLESMQHHITAFANGEDLDAESGESHMGHIMCNAAFLEHFRVFKKHVPYLEAKLDDRDGFGYQMDEDT